MAVADTQPVQQGFLKACIGHNHDHQPMAIAPPPRTLPQQTHRPRYRLHSLHRAPEVFEHMIGHLERLKDTVGPNAAPFNALGMVCKRVGGHGTAQRCQPGIFCT
ncbi:hypothetical protein J6396_40445, partial [Pseudomonas aeruginosa]|nr:hypothetical protein [Pseudomonas aeruginosa]